MTDSLFQTTSEGFAQCPAGLKKLLTEGDDWKSCVRLITINDTLAAQLVAFQPVLAAMGRHPSHDELVAYLDRVGPLYGVPADFGLWGSYIEALSTVPLWALDEAFSTWNETPSGKINIFPKADQLVPLAKAAMAEVINARFRSRHAMEKIAQRPARETPEEKARVAAEMKAFAATLGTRRCVPDPDEEIVV